MVFTHEAANELKIGGYINYSAATLGVDSPEHCFNQRYYQSFPHSVAYNYNELGFRERPIELYNKNSIICIGDSFTLGLGLPIELTYPQQLENVVQHPVLNFSLNGASNDWIARKLEIILKYFTPRAIIVHYTFSHRRESNNTNWFDDERTLCDPLPSKQENISNWKNAHTQITNLVQSIPTCYSFIPGWHPDPITFNDPLIKVSQTDYARDRFHYGELTCLTLAQAYADYINQ